MARKAMIEKSKKEPKFAVRQHNRCKICGRTHGYISRFGICRHCLRKLALRGEVPGVKKASW
jgi:small subunit ribosomal protein S14